MSFVPVCTLDDVPVGAARPYTVASTPVAVVRTDDGVYAILDECSHAAVPLSEGDVEGCTVECYMHGSRFDLRTGRPLELPATQPVPIYPVQITDTQVLIDLDSPIQTDEIQEPSN